MEVRFREGQVLGLRPGLHLKGVGKGGLRKVQAEKVGSVWNPAYASVNGFEQNGFIGKQQGIEICDMWSNGEPSASPEKERRGALMDLGGKSLMKEVSFRAH